MKTGLKIALVLAFAWRAGAADPGEEVRKGNMIERVAGKVDGANETHLSLDVQNAPLGDVLSMMREMGATPLDTLTPGEMPKANVTEKNATFLNALKKVCQSTNMTLDRSSPGLSIGYKLTPGDDLWKLPTCDSGWAMTFATAAGKHGVMPFSTAGVSSSETTISMLLITERYKPILKHSAIGQVDEALTDKGESLVTDKQPEPELNQYSRGVMPFVVKIKNAPSGSKLKTLKGRVWVALEEKSEDWVIENPFSAERQSKSIAGVEMLNFQHQNSGILLTMKANAQAGRAMLMSPELLDDRVVFLDAAGKPVSITGRAAGSGSSLINGVAVVTQFDKNYFPMENDPDVAKLIIKIPTEIKAVVIPFEFHDLDLP